MKSNHGGIMTVAKDCPYNDLYIYYLQGRIPDNQEWFGKSFIGNWQEEDCSFLFFSEPAKENVEAVVDNVPETQLLDTFHMTYSQWHGHSPENLQVGRFHISPPWKNQGKPANGPKPVSNDRGSEIWLDPGVVFGTGTHSTTRDCLELIEKACLENKVRSVLDLGTGTGILSLAAASLGCSPVIALDYNALAVKTAMKNVLINGFEKQILAVRGKAEDFIHMDADLLIANIHYDVMIEIVQTPAFKRYPQFILSGLLHRQAMQIGSVLARQGAKINDMFRRDGIWYSFWGKNVSDG